MSYIRSTENPEGLYIWGDGEGGLSISPDAETILHISQRTFHEILLKWWENIEEITDERQPLTIDGATMRAEFRHFLGGSNLVYVLTHESWKKGKEVVAMTTTWHYLLCDVVDREADGPLGKSLDDTP